MLVWDGLRKGVAQQWTGGVLDSSGCVHLRVVSFCGGKADGPRSSGPSRNRVRVWSRRAQSCSIRRLVPQPAEAARLLRHRLWHRWRRHRPPCRRHSKLCPLQSRGSAVSRARRPQTWAVRPPQRNGGLANQRPRPAREHDAGYRGRVAWQEAHSWQ